MIAAACRALTGSEFEPGRKTSSTLFPELQRATRPSRTSLAAPAQALRQGTPLCELRGRT